MARITVTLSMEAMENLEKLQKEISEKMGGGRVTSGFALGYALKKCVAVEEKEEKEEK